MACALGCGLDKAVPAGGALWAQVAQDTATSPIAGNSVQQRGSATPGDEPALTLSVTTREVVVDVLATDHHGLPLADLQRSEFAISELNEQGQKIAQKITEVRFIDPATEPNRSTTEEGGPLRVALGGGCAERTTAHYEIAYQVSADRRQSGYHQIMVTTVRNDAKLAFSPRYYVGQTGLAASPQANKSERQETRTDESAVLEAAACLHPSVPVSIRLRVYLVHSGEAAAIRYQVVIPKQSLPLVGFTVDSRQVALEYGACTFSADGKPLQFTHAGVHQTLTLAQYAQTAIHGLPMLLDVPKTGDPAFVRFVVRDPENGNLGSVMADTGSPLAPGALTPAEAEQEAVWKREGEMSIGWIGIKDPVMGPLGSFGSVEPRAGALCGDVYELATDTPKLPNYWTLASIGSLYTDILDVPHQQFWNTGGVPGVTRKTDWFGIDYHGAFWVRNPGRYDFRVLADDGAKLFVDDRLVIDADGPHNLIDENNTIELAAGRHTMHLPYYQGRQRSVALQLLVKPPGEKKYQLFDQRDYRQPAGITEPSTH